MHRMERTRFFLILLLHSCMASLTGVVVAAQRNNVDTDQTALLALKVHITSDPQKIMANWSIATSVCNWVGITCGARHLRVVALNISYFGLTNTIPPELGNLSFLVQLDFTNNSFHGTLPTVLSRLHRLKLISFGYNNFIGSVPREIGNLTMLKEIILEGNNFKGIPNDALTGPLPVAVKLKIDLLIFPLL
ncbi:LRR receptor-like serine/threonine-protein kinase EFR [Argentina anserina]|uniref:LRR receptor-like serine/threonine-protein kinase EFR n=1 Tax=Argentina anserina TaxID=57926 RepID=UPI0021766F4D|nr:LRR receptor-like serine/threonine-protein kinase EFR [Potentilla anserina]